MPQHALTILPSNLSDNLITKCSTSHCCILKKKPRETDDRVLDQNGLGGSSSLTSQTNVCLICAKLMLKCNCETKRSSFIIILPGRTTGQKSIDRRRFFSVGKKLKKGGWMHLKHSTANSIAHLAIYPLSDRFFAVPFFPLSSIY